MKKLIKAVYIFAPEVMSVDEDTLIVTLDDKEIAHGKLRNIEMICYYGYKPIRPSLIDACVRNGVRLNLFHPEGQFIASVGGSDEKVAQLRRRQYAEIGTPHMGLEIAKNMIMAKVFNTRWLFGLMFRDYGDRMDKGFIKTKTEQYKKILGEVVEAKDLETLRKIQKTATKEWYAAMDHLIVRQKKTFKFKERVMKPPMDPINVLLSFVHELVEDACIGAVESVGFDAYAGFLHKDKPGQMSLVLDLMEETKICLGDRFALTVVNEGVIGSEAFEEEEEGAGHFVLTDGGIDAILAYWREFTAFETMHPYLEEKLEWSLVPYSSAMLLARFLRDEIDKYPPFLRKKPV